MDASNDSRDVRSVDQIARNLEEDIRDTIQRICAPLQCQVRDSVTLVALVLFIGTAYLLARLIVEN